MLTKAVQKKQGKLTEKDIQTVLKDKYLQVTIKGKPFHLDSTHPTFNRMAKAIRDKNWKLLPKLVSVAQNLFNSTAGNIQVKDGVIYYKGSPVDDSLARHIVDMIKDGKEVGKMLLFMNNLYKNESPEARQEFFSWFKTSDLPITDDGCFLAYKSVDQNLRDEHTHTILNAPGQVIMMPRVAADKNYRNQCSYGFHVCSKQYGLYGRRVMAVKINPRDILSAEGGKMRVLRYEVLYELGEKGKLEFKQEGFPDLEKKVMVEFQGERKDLIKAILSAPAIKRAIKDKKISENTIRKSAHTRLKSIAQRYEVVDAEPVTRQIRTTQTGVTQGEVVKLSSLPILEQARKAAGFSIGQVAEKMGVSYKVVAKLEKEVEPNREKLDKFLEAIWLLQGKSLSQLSRGAITFPKAVAAA